MPVVVNRTCSVVSNIVVVTYVVVVSDIIVIITDVVIISDIIDIVTDIVVSNSIVVDRRRHESSPILASGPRCAARPDALPLASMTYLV